MRKNTGIFAITSHAQCHSTYLSVEMTACCPVFLPWLNDDLDDTTQAATEKQ